ncbi:MAG: hypothetical protein WCX69_00765 [Candidatus Paceibacterota bacterium]
MDKKIFAAVSLSIFSFVIMPGAADAACNLVSGKTYYSDGVSNFSDAACRQEITASGSDSEVVAATATGYINTGSGNCRYSLAKQQYSDGISFFTDNKCAVEALNDDAVPAPAATQTQKTAGALVVVAGASTQDNQRIAALEKKVDAMMAIIAQILSLLAKK